MQIEFDPKKDKQNRHKHGISLAEANKLEWDTLWTFEDYRFDYGELRMIGIGYIGSKLYTFAYTELQEDHWRIISLRLVTKPEIQRYANT